jgi:hypothetical protein
LSTGFYVVYHSEFARVIFPPLKIAFKNYHSGDGVNYRLALFASCIRFIEVPCGGNSRLSLVPHPYGNLDLSTELFGKITAKFGSRTFGTVHVERQPHNYSFRFVLFCGGGNLFDCVLKALFLNDSYRLSKKLRFVTHGKPGSRVAEIH